MLKIARIRETYHIFDTINGTFFSINATSWEIIKAVKKHGQEKAIKEIANLFNISEKQAKKDIVYILNELEEVKIDINDVPLKISNNEYAPRSVEFDISARCNSKCIYCLASERMKSPTELSTEQIIKVIDDLNELGMWSITVSGGEPTLRPDLFEILDHIDNLELAMSVFTNGMTIDEETAKNFSKFKHLFVQISLDSANPEHHDMHRGVKGAFEKTVQGIKNLLKYNIFIEVAVVATPTNLNDIEELAKFLYKLNIKSVRITPAVLLGRACDNEKKIELKPAELKKIGERISNLNKKYRGKMVFSNSPHMVQFTGDTSSKEPIKMCGIGKNNLYIAPDGLVYPCMCLAFHDFILGDVKKDDVKKIWNTSPLIKELRELSVEQFEKCGSCKVKKLCNGGCRGTAYIASKSITAPDPVFCAYFGC